jgi:hypothetical protein
MGDNETDNPEQDAVEYMSKGLCALGRTCHGDSKSWTPCSMKTHTVAVSFHAYLFRRRVSLRICDIALPDALGHVLDVDTN